MAYISLLTIPTRKLRRGRVERGPGEEGRGHWLEKLPICQHLTVVATGINSNKVELVAVLLTSHALSQSQLATGGAGEFTQLLAASPPSSLHVKLPLPPVLPLSNSPLFILPADSGSKHNEDLSDKKGSYSTGWRDCGRARNVIFEWLIKKWNRWEQSLSRRDGEEGLGITEQAARWLQAL